MSAEKDVPPQRTYLKSFLPQTQLMSVPEQSTEWSHKLVIGTTLSAPVVYEKNIAHEVPTYHY